MRGALTRDAWRAEAVKRYGEDHLKWRFRCPACKHVASVQDWLGAKAPEGAIAFSCIGRFLPATPREAFTAKKVGGPCNYAGGGMFRINPIHVAQEDGGEHLVFDFADDPLATPSPQEDAPTPEAGGAHG